MPSAAPSFLLLRFLCRYKENEVAVGQPRRFRFFLVLVLCPWRILTVKKAEPAGRVPPDAILLSGNKSMQKCLLLAEGISFAGFMRLQEPAVMGIRPCDKGPDLSV